MNPQSPAKPPTVFLVEDVRELREAAQQSLELEGLDVAAFPDARSAYAALSPDFAGVIVTDVRMPGVDGIEFFQQVRELDPELPVILVTGHGDVAMAVEAMRNGAADFLTKPYSTAALIRSIRTAAERRALVLENRKLRAALSAQSGKTFVGSSQPAQNLRSLIEAVAPTDIDVVLEGEAGAGKSTVARLIHDLGPRSSRPFITVDAGMLAHEDADLLLFGRDPSAGLSRTGLLERANGGTLFLDELAFHSDPIHSRLLAMLDSRSVQPVGAERARKLNIRIILARNPAIEGPTAERDDRFAQRLGAIKIAIPSLAERPSDLPEIFRHFVAIHERELGVEAPAFGDPEWSHIQTHDWAGNLRELSGFAHAFVLGLWNVATESRAPAEQRSLLDRVAEFERALLEDALKHAKGSVSRLEHTLQTPRKTLYDKLKRHDLKPNDFK